jgi:hypothetical protein
MKLVGSEPLTENPLVMEVIVGAGIAIAVAIPAHLLLRLANLSWSWGMPFAAAGGIAIRTEPVASWQVAVAASGLLTARWGCVRCRPLNDSAGGGPMKARCTALRKYGPFLGSRGPERGREKSDGEGPRFRSSKRNSEA